MINLSKLSRAWNLSPILSTSIPETGTVHQTLLLKTQAGDYALRAYRYKSEDRWRIDCEHEIIIYAQAHGLPAVVPLRLSNGQTILEHEEHFYALLPFARGYQRKREQLLQSEISVMGNCLGQIHQALHDYPHQRVHHRSLTVDHAATLEQMNIIEAVILAQPSLKDEDWQSLSHLRARRAWLAMLQPVESKEFLQLEQQVTHGDYQETNLFFEDGQVSAVIDWDQAHVAPRAWEVIRSFHYALKLDEASCSTFLHGYRQVLPLSVADLQVAATFYGWLLAFNLWNYEEVYLKNNQRVRSFLPTGPFIPFIQRWNDLQKTLSRA